MANWVTTIYKIDGDKEQVQKVYEKIKETMSMVKPLVVSDFGVQWGPNYVQTGEGSYITLPAAESLMETREGLTLLTWIAPQAPVKPHTYADFFTKGDYTLMKMEGY